MPLLTGGLGGAARGGGGGGGAGSPGTLDLVMLVPSLESSSLSISITSRGSTSARSFPAFISISLRVYNKQSTWKINQSQTASFCCFGGLIIVCFPDFGK